MTIVKASQRQSIESGFLAIISEVVAGVRSKKDTRHDIHDTRDFDVNGLKVEVIIRSTGHWVKDDLNSAVINDPKFKVVAATVKVNGAIVGPIAIQNEDLDGNGPTDQELRDITASVTDRFMEIVARSHLGSEKLGLKMVEMIKAKDYIGFAKEFVPNTTWTYGDSNLSILHTNDFGEVLLQVIRVDKLGLSEAPDSELVKIIYNHLVKLVAHMYSMGEWERETPINF